MKLIDYVNPQGAQAALAKALSVPPVLISQWANGKRAVPLDRCVQIERASNGAVTCEELRPDKADYWAYLRAAPGSAARRADNPKPGPVVSDAEDLQPSRKNLLECRVDQPAVPERPKKK